jgi:hypothetical protein
METANAEDEAEVAEEGKEQQADINNRVDIYCVGRFFANLNLLRAADEQIQKRIERKTLQIK